MQFVSSRVTERKFNTTCRRKESGWEQRRFVMWRGISSAIILTGCSKDQLRELQGLPFDFTLHKKPPLISRDLHRG